MPFGFKGLVAQAPVLSPELSTAVVEGLDRNGQVAHHAGVGSGQFLTADERVNAEMGAVFRAKMAEAAQEVQDIVGTKKMLSLKERFTDLGRLIFLRTGYWAGLWFVIVEQITVHSDWTEILKLRGLLVPQPVRKQRVKRFRISWVMVTFSG